MCGNKPTRVKRIAKAAVLGASLASLGAARLALADFSGTPSTFKVDGGWCWFQDPRAVIINGQIVFGSVAGTTVTGVSTGGDEDATDLNLTTHAITTTTLVSAYDQDDHASPAFAVLPDNRILVTYESHGAGNVVLWRISTNAGDGTTWGAQQSSTVNTVNDSNGDSYNNPYYLSVDNTVYDFSRAIGYDPNYSEFTNISSTNNAGLTSAANFQYGGHALYWQNPNTAPLTGGNGRPYVKYASNGTDTIWIATTNDSPQNYLNSLYSGYVQFNSSGGGNVYQSNGTLLGGISTGTAPTGNANPPTTGGNQGSIASGTGFSYNPTQLTPIVEADTTYGGLDLSSTSVYGAGYVGWATSMQLDSTGSPYLGFVVVRNLTGAYGNDLEYDYAHLINGAWQVDRVGYAGLPLYNGQNQYAGLMAVDPLDPDKIYISDDVNPITNAAIDGPDGNQHWEIFEGVTTTNGTSWSWTQLTDTSSDNIRPVVTTGSGEEALLWMQGTYTAYTSYNTNIVGLTESLITTAPVGIVKADTTGLASGSDWTGGSAPGVNGIALFDTTISASHEAALSSPTNLSWQGITVSPTNGPVAITNSTPFTLTLGSGGINMSSATYNLSIAASLTLQPDTNQAWIIPAGLGLALKTGAFTRGAGATLNIQNAGTVSDSMTSLSNDASEGSGILPPWITIGTGPNTTYAALSSGNISSYKYVTTGNYSIPTTVTASTNYQITVGGVVTFGAATRSVNTLTNIGGASTLTFGNSTSLIQLVTNGILNSGSGPLTIAAGGSNAGSGVGIGSNRELVLNTANAGITISAPIANSISGSSSLTITGSYVTTLSGADTYTGPTTVTSGTLLLASNGALPAGTTLSIGPGATLQIADHNSGSDYEPIISGLSNNGTVDLLNNAMVIHNGSIGTVSSEVAAAYNNGAWNGSSGTSGVITSTTAAEDSTHLTAVGIVTGLTSFESTVVAASDVLLKYTYYGDANLDGKVDGTDYSRIDSGALSHATGWFNGDFNYDGVINGSDYTLIDNAFNTQSVQLTAAIAIPTAHISGGTTGASEVPEPAMLTALAVCGLQCLARRRLHPR